MPGEAGGAEGGRKGTCFLAEANSVIWQPIILARQIDVSYISSSDKTI